MNMFKKTPSEKKERFKEGLECMFFFVFESVPHFSGNNIIKMMSVDR